MPTALQKQITAGAQEFLGAHAYYLTEGRLPENINDHSRFFHIHDVRHHNGCWEAFFGITFGIVAGDFVRHYIGSITKNLAEDAATATTAAFEHFVKRSYHSWRQRRPISEEVFSRTEPVLTEMGGNGAPLIVTNFEGEHQRRRLYERVNTSMQKITAPLGRSATHVDIWVGSERIDRRNHRFSVTEEEITAAIFPIHTAWQRGRRPT